MVFIVAENVEISPVHRRAPWYTVQARKRRVYISIIISIVHC